MAPLQCVSNISNAITRNNNFPDSPILVPVSFRAPFAPDKNLPDVIYFDMGILIPSPQERRIP